MENNGKTYIKLDERELIKIKKTLHTHPKLEQIKGIDINHVIIDKDVYENICKLINKCPYGFEWGLIKW